MNIAIIVLCIALAAAGVDIYRLRKREKTVMVVAKQVDELYCLARAEVTKNKKLIEDAKKIIDNPFIPQSALKTSTRYGEPELSSPEVLSTLVTVLINKFGTTRISMNDFAALDATEDFVSVYVDNDAMEIILSLDHNLASSSVSSADYEEDPFSGIFSKSPKDDTYH